MKRAATRRARLSLEDLVLQLMLQVVSDELDGPRVRARLLTAAPALLRL